ncbi:MAG: DUF1801 domain-containing protein [bacterium]|jgi:hypothetical protein
MANELEAEQFKQETSIRVAPPAGHVMPKPHVEAASRAIAVAPNHHGKPAVGRGTLICMKSSAKTVKEYLQSLPDDRRKAIEAVRKVILKNLDKDYEESMLWGMIGYAVPHRVWPTGYHCDPTKPLMVAALASQKDNLTVYLMSVYSDKAERAWFEKAWAKTGKKLNMGGSCVRFRKLEDAALDVIGEAIRRVPAKAYVESYVKSLASTGRGPDGKKLKPDATAAKKTVAKKPAKPATRAKAKRPAKKSVKP